MQTKLKDLPDLFSKKIYNGLKRSLILTFTLEQYVAEGGKCSGRLRYINKRFMSTITKRDVIKFNHVLRKKLYPPKKCDNCGKTCMREFSIDRNAAFNKEKKQHRTDYDFRYHVYKRGRPNTYLCLRDCNIYGGNDDLTIEYKNGLSTKAYYALGNNYQLPHERTVKPNPQIANQVMLFIVKQVVDTVVYEAQKLLQENACPDELSEFSYRYKHNRTCSEFPCTRFCDQWNIRYTEKQYLQHEWSWTRWVYVSDLQDWFDALKVHVQLQLKERAIQIAKCLNPPSSYIRDGLKQQKTLKLTKEYQFIPIDEAFKAKTLPQLPPQVIQIIYDYAIPQRQYVVTSMPPNHNINAAQVARVGKFSFSDNPRNSNSDIIQHLCYVYALKASNDSVWVPRLMGERDNQKKRKLICDALLRGNSMKQYILKLLD